MAPRMRYTTKKVITLSTGSESRPCWRVAVLDVRAGLAEGGHQEVGARRRSRRRTRWR